MACGILAPQPETEGLPCGSDGKESAFNAGDLGPVPGLGRATGGGHSSILPWRIHKDRGAWQAIVRGVAKSRTRLSN